MMYKSEAKGILYEREINSLFYDGNPPVTCL